ncbi:regulator of chromatin subfamily A member 3-like 1 [Seminavis robusta]|uniref:Regulator of chromatin subfamily A member 3-like 1 n=1 Tax=Seminavis robusta TaxID=568900 RepID=A0A9N8E488_9STRA|nr:regulator of chromatin subfamily A member 3-like 1 [Seminavis robusta]|eukprot:Sro535_g161980.1 regulator of chromatin subfamily A member 3-like 1 (685) ;mRNA; f:39800-42695
MDRKPLAPADGKVNIESVDDLVPLLAKKLHVSEPPPPNKSNNEDVLLDEEDDHPNVSNVKVDWEKERDEMDKMFEEQAAKQLDGLPEFVKPQRLKKSVNVFEHQKEGIRWLLHQEMNPRENPFVRRRTLKSGVVAMYDRLTKRRIGEAYEPSRGSILADDMGLGKTLQTIATILSNPPDDYRYGKSVDSDIPICTVIVCPKTVISNWLEQIDTFVKPGTFRVQVYTGTPKQRSKIIEKVQDNEIDILLSSYETISAEFKEDAKDYKINTIHDEKTEFHRIVLDEAQTIRNGKSKVFRAITSVANKSDFRLALTGTPFVNKPDDIHSLLTFIGLDPLADVNTFKQYITDPIKDRKRAGLTRLRAALAYVALRRTKNACGDSVKLPPKTITVQTVDFPEGQHKEIHDALFFSARKAFEASINGNVESETGVTKVAQSAMFGLLTRVRQSCASGALVAAGHFDVARQVMEMENRQGEEGDRALDLLQSSDASNGQRIRVEQNSPKIAALLNGIEAMAADEKAVIFSQWTSFLDLIEVALNSTGHEHEFVRIDGSMTTAQRTNSMDRLTNDEGCRFILCSLKAAGVGINLTRANVVFMMDPWWNDATEMQAIDRVHRMGQQRPVRIYRLVMRGSVEERMLAVQRAKATMGKGTMKKLSASEEKLAKMTGLKDLFQINEEADDNFIVWE